MARSKTKSGFFGGLFGRKKSRAKKSNLRRYVWMFLVFITGSGGVAGVSEYQVLKKIWEIVRDRWDQIPVARTTGEAGDTGAVRVFFTHPEQGGPASGDAASSLATLIDQTRQSIDVCAFELDNQVIVDALVRAVRRGVRVRLATETDYLGESGVAALRAVGVPIVDDARPGSLMHDKFMVFDRRAVWTGSMNFTENCAYKNDNHGLFIEDVRLADNYATKFAWMHEQRKFGPPPSKGDRIPNPLVTLSDGTQLENYFSPHDKTASKVIEAIRLAKKSIHFLAFSYTHDGIAEVMLSRAAAGVEVSGVFEKTQTAGGYSEYSKLKAAGLAVWLDGNPRNMHHKAIVIDGEIVVAGSFNFSENADKSNDENLLIIYHRGVAAAFEGEFQRVAKIARDAEGR